MPTKALHELRNVLDQEGSFMVPAGEDRVAQLALIHAMRTMTDALERVAVRQDQDRETMSDMVKTLHNIDKRLSVIEGNALNGKVTEIDARLQELEDDNVRRKAERGVGDWLVQRWTSLLAFFALIVYVVLDRSDKL